MIMMQARLLNMRRGILKETGLVAAKHASRDSRSCQKSPEKKAGLGFSEFVILLSLRHSCHVSIPKSRKGEKRR